ncbi:HlyD family efflux transporter periplasmic adaptor subunit [Microcoleus sp. FACHB-68]|uniref:HlyD family efflux transporter periplasmic adaptor subunit n=1 Tax=Microcoleus sp. FACHB-68 TaxID=2692826 RepID=UPI001681DA72|nr:HlyD family efflux transporter periplasmic adaptor subunit [Microcoleus sp. FACHB-68]MBD1939413.1 HlyD family efflux transporter periplasmic adaptor subunit [Microcoleus sp. FACHB-68]
MLSESDSEFFQPLNSNEFLPPISLWTRLGGLFLVATFGIGVTVAAITKYNVTVKAAATVRPTGDLRLIQAAAQGSVNRIEIKENQAVKQGEVIAYIDDSQLQTKKNQLQGNIQNNQLQLTQLDAQMKAIDGQVAAETDRNNRMVASAQADLIRTQRDYQNQQVTSVAGVSEAVANLRSSEEELQKAQADLTSAEANLRSIEAALKSARTRRDRYQPLVESGGLSQDQFEEVKLAVEQQEEAVEQQKAVIAGQKQAIERQQQAIEAAKARLQGASAGLDPSEAIVAMAREKIDQEKAAGVATLARLNQEREQLIQRKVELQSQLGRDQQELQQIETELKYTVIRAPVSGTIHQLNLRNTSQMVRPGDLIAQISPSEAPLVVKALVSSEDISRVKAGQAVQMRVSACPYPDYGILKGKVTGVSPDAMKPDVNSQSPQTPTSNAAFFEVTVQPENLALVQGDRKCPIQAGMQGTADIISRKETVLTFILRKARLLTDL